MDQVMLLSGVCSIFSPPSLQFLDLINFACSLLATAQEDEDMWHAYNLIQQGDEIRGSAVR